MPALLTLTPEQIATIKDRGVLRLLTKTADAAFANALAAVSADPALSTSPKVVQLIDAAAVVEAIRAASQPKLRKVKAKTKKAP